jgi:hypothetical protein
MRPATGGAPVAVKSSPVSRSTKVEASGILKCRYSVSLQDFIFFSD